MKNSNSSTLSLLNTIKFFAFDFKSLVYISQLSETNIHHSSSFIHYIYSNNLSLESKIIFKNSVAKSKKSTIESFASEIGGLESTIKGLEIEFGSLENAIGRLENAIGSLENAIGSLENAIERLENAIGGLENAIGGLENAIGSLENAIGTFAKYIQLSYYQYKNKLGEFCLTKSSNNFNYINI